MPSNRYHFSDYGYNYYVTINTTTNMTIIMITNNGLNSCKHDQLVLFKLLNKLWQPWING